MLRSRLDLNLLAVFDAIYARGGVSQAARHLNLSQSAVSHALSRLRHEFNDALFVRAGNAFVPTALARSIAAPVREALRGIDVAVAAASTFEPATSSRLFRLGLRQGSEVRLFPDLVTQVRGLAPGVSLASVNFRRADIAGALAHGDLDAVIDVPSGGTEGLRAQRLYADPLVVAARPGHPLIRGAIDLATYLAVEHVVATPRSSGPDPEDATLAASGQARRVALRCQHAWTAWRIVAGSDMILTLLETHARALMPLAPLQLLPPPIALAPGEFHLYWHDAFDADPGSAWLRGLITTLCEGA